MSEYLNYLVNGDLTAIMMMIKSMENREALVAMLDNEETLRKQAKVEATNIFDLEAAEAKLNELYTAVRNRIDEIDNPPKAKSYINTMEYHWMLVLREVGVQLTYEEMVEFMQDAEDRHIDFGTKHPYEFTDREIINEYIQYFEVE